MKYYLFIYCFLVFLLPSKAQSYLFFATQPEAFLDSTCTKKIRKLTKGECVMVENLVPYKKKYYYGTCIKDGKAGFIQTSYLKQEKTYFPDSLGTNPISKAKKEYLQPFARLINTSKRSTIKLSILGKAYVLKPGEKQELTIKAGIHRFKVETMGYQPLYTQDSFQPYHIVEVEFFIE